MTRDAGFRARNRCLRIVLFVATFGFYGVYWLYRFHSELADEVDGDVSPLLRTVGLFVPPISLLVMWKDAVALEEVLPDRAGTYMLLHVIPVFTPLWWYKVQTEINEHVRSRDA